MFEYHKRFCKECCNLICNDINNCKLSIEEKIKIAEKERHKLKSWIQEYIKQSQHSLDG